MNVSETESAVIGNRQIMILVIGNRQIMILVIGNRQIMILVIANRQIMILVIGGPKNADRSISNDYDESLTLISYIDDYIEEQQLQMRKH